MDRTRADASALRPVRTYAQDLESERQRRQLPTPDSAPAKAKEPAPKVKAEPGPHITTAPAKKMPPLPKPAPDAQSNHRDGAVVSIPPFHDLTKRSKPTSPSPANKKIEPDSSITVIAPLPKAAADNHQRNQKSLIIDDSGDTEDATIITDTKRQSFRFFPTLITSVKNWFTELETAYKQRKTPKYTVPETDRRKGVIQRATSQTGKIATADHEIVRQRIKNRGFIQPKDDDSPTTWTANTETIFPLLTGPKGAKESPVVNVQVVPKKRAATVPTPPPPPKRSAPIIPKPVFVEPDPDTETAWEQPEPEELPVAEDLVPPAATSALPIAEETAKQTEGQDDDAETEEAAADNSLSTGNFNARNAEVYDDADKESDREPSETTLDNWRVSLQELSTNALTLTIVGAIVLCTATFFGLRLLLSDSQGTNVIATMPESLIDGVPLIEKADSFTNRNELLSLIAAELEQANNETAQVVFTTRENRQLVPPSTILNTLSQDIDQNFARSVTHLTFGKHGQNQPYLVLRVTDNTTARGGLLQWEDTMATALSPLFTEPQTSTSTALFRDRRSGETEVRSLEDLNSTSYITYGFVTNETLIITTTPDAFSALVPLVITAN